MDKSWMPTRKWWVTQTAAVSALLIAWVNVGAWDKTTTIGLIGLLSQSICSWLAPNHEAPGGVPLRSERKAFVKGRRVSATAR